jgi:predicted metal-binding membrane protein
MSLEALLRRDRVLAGAGLAGLTVLAWAYLVQMARHAGMEMAPAMPMALPWGGRDLLLAFLMWAAMMVGMMVPSASPMILLFATINRKRAGAGDVSVPTTVFLAGYLAVWTGFSLAAALGQWALQAVALLSPATMTATPVVGGLLLLAAGAYQFTPLKNACLAQCQSPLSFILTSWREGARGAFTMGLRHGAFCVGCCWALMVLLFVAGVMNLAWVAAIAAFVLVEKLAPGGRVVSRVAGVVLLAWGAWVLATSLWA